MCELSNQFSESKKKLFRRIAFAVEAPPADELEYLSAAIPLFLIGRHLQSDLNFWGATQSERSNLENTSRPFHRLLLPLEQGSPPLLHIVHFSAAHVSIMPSLLKGNNDGGGTHSCRTA
ncbi:hypothetical protein GCM10010503_38840 [Streptomyces lucensis JCM 4490]|uniref:Uncharacterized protein n=1 Tax=Streptomyces lucensis JCM 4490 TaxID=1306176 RepID=A0A918J805_9ACTN|nr:hypothetical protein [Streptomyces lucensis]GGW58050.1 hypothetical protein GCM10010503_38840 [Streptomyces lucensis JCM 4490]